ncbi:putative nucleotidyltransferase [Homoserinimonas aerilata]|uniref:Putative nucleotidyltransferase n=1 Tax=Homoserinimonas aerilata TaxID=1162970 RepID=A0A542YGF6_9MICO|nr:nucleotidyltransferase domain-containing protein [Homoserinimonas aerilata]TQL47155.1 putative nucleotidyltransferase [Homoserinimonas aerilata]
MTAPQPITVTTVADARSGLSQILRTFRLAPRSASPVTIGSHRRPESVLVPFEQFRSLARGSATAAGTLLDELQARGKLIRRLAALNNITEVSVFGSVARRAENELSDVDLLVTPSTNASLFDLAQFEIDMEQLIGRDVDVVSRHPLDPVRDSTILNEAVPL